MLSIVGAVVSEKGGWRATGRHAEEGEDGLGDVDTDGRNDDWANAVAHDAADGGFDGSTGKRAGGSPLPAGDFDSGGAADGDWVTGEVGGSWASAAGEPTLAEPGENEEVVETVEELETLVLCDSS